ncbi:MAG: hypothetical protein JHC93_08270 [Parachlamydiales bacterium]|nr:hypothetical protein [Parachlamydiales bacterium]
MTQPIYTSDFQLPYPINKAHNFGVVSKKRGDCSKDPNHRTNKLKRVVDAYFNGTLPINNPLKACFRLIARKWHLVNIPSITEIDNSEHCFSIGVHKGQFFGHFDNCIAKISSKVEFPDYDSNKEKYDYSSQHSNHHRFHNLGVYINPKMDFGFIENRSHQKFTPTHNMYMKSHDYIRDVVRLDDVYFVNNGTSIFTMYLDGCIRATIKRTDEYPNEHEFYPFTAVTLFKDHFVVGFKSGDIKFYDKDLKSIHFFSTSDTVTALTVCRNKLVSAHRNNRNLFVQGEIRIWNSDKSYYLYSGTDNYISNLTHIGDCIVAATQDSIKIWDEDGICYYILPHNHSIFNIAVNGSKILFSIEGHSFYLLDFGDKTRSIKYPESDNFKTTPVIYEKKTLPKIKVNQNFIIKSFKKFEILSSRFND